MSWNLEEAAAYYKRQGAPGDQNALIGLLREVQTECGGSIRRYMLTEIAAALAVKESFLLAVVRRIPSLRLADTHCLEVCAGPNCGRSAVLAKLAEQLRSDTITVKTVPCMRQCGKGPNIRWDGTMYNRADEALLRRLTKGE